MELLNMIHKRGEAYPLAEMDFSNIPKIQNRCSWEKAVGCKIPFKWIDIEGELVFLEYKSSTKYVLQYNERVFEISNYDLIHGKLCRLFINPGTKYWYEIGEIVEAKGDSRFKILDRYKKGNSKYYKIECQDCHFQSERLEKDVKKSCCGNCYDPTECNIEDSVWIKAPWMVEYFPDKESTKKIACHSKQIIPFVCPHCGKVKNKPVAYLYRDGHLGCSCELKQSLPECIMMHILDLFDIKYISQLSRTHFDWIKNMRRYDFYLPDYNMIIETHGELHYHEPRQSFFKSLAEQLAIDKEKREMALSNGIKYYFEVDCSHAVDIVSMINNLTEVLNVLGIDIELVREMNLRQRYSQEEIINKIEEYITDNPNWSRKEILLKFNITRHYYEKYIKIIKERRIECQN